MLNRQLKSRGLVLAIAMGLLTMPALALATTSFYHVTFTTLNDSGVSGNASLKLDGNTLQVHIRATGLQNDVAHLQHIHGPFDSGGNPSQAMTPTTADDTNSDNYIELGEGAMAYGPILVPLTSSSGDFPTPTDGTIDFSQSYDLTDSSIYNASYGQSDLFPLTFREIVLHGMDAPINLIDNGTNYAIGEYDPVFPIASGIIQEGRLAVPEPSSIFDMLAGLGVMLALVGIGRRRMRRGKTV